MTTPSTNPDGRTFGEVVDHAPTVHDFETLRVEGVGCTFVVTHTLPRRFASTTEHYMVSDVWVGGGMSGFVWLARHDSQAAAYADACNRVLESVAAEAGEEYFTKLDPVDVRRPSDTSRLYRP